MRLCVYAYGWMDGWMSYCGLCLLVDQKWTTSGRPVIDQLSTIGRPFWTPTSTDHFCSWSADHGRIFRPRPPALEITIFYFTNLAGFFSGRILGQNPFFFLNPARKINPAGTKSLAEKDSCQGYFGNSCRAAGKNEYARTYFSFLF
jgi:hypothetical protein